MKGNVLVPANRREVLDSSLDTSISLLLLEERRNLFLFGRRYQPRKRSKGLYFSYLSSLVEFLGHGEDEEVDWIGGSARLQTDRWVPRRQKIHF